MHEQLSGAHSAATAATQLALQPSAQHSGFCWHTFTTHS